MAYTLVAEEEADLKLGKISINSPFGKGLFGKKLGETAEIQAPAGVVEVEILEITSAPACWPDAATGASAPAPSGSSGSTGPAPASAHRERPRCRRGA